MIVPLQILIWIESILIGDLLVSFVIIIKLFLKEEKSNPRCNLKGIKSIYLLYQIHPHKIR